MKQLLLFLILIIVVLSEDNSTTNAGECTSAEKFSCYPKGCLNASCIECTEDWQCYNYPKYVCSITTKKCNMEPISNFKFNLSWYEILSLFVALALTSFSIIGGVGGGPLLVSAMITVGQYHISVTSPLSTSIIFGAAVASIIIMSTNKHPKVNRPLIGYDFVAAVEPIILAGTMIGVLFNQMFPQWLVLVCICIVSVLSFLKVTQKAVKMYKNENKTLKKEKEGEDDNNNGDIELVEKKEKKIESVVKEEEKEELEKDKKKEEEKKDDEEETTKTGDSETNEMEEGEGETEEEKEEKEKEEEESSEGANDQKKEIVINEKGKKILDKYESLLFPIHKIIYLLIAWGFVLVVALLRGSKRASSVIGIKSCSWTYWIILWVSFPVLILMSYFYAFILFLKHKFINKKYGFVYAEGEMRWTLWRTIFIPIVFVVSGIVASLIGTGGGLVNGPLMMLLGIDPQIMIPTNMLMILFTSSSSYVQFLVSKKLPTDYAIILFIGGFIAAIIGRFSSKIIIQKTGRRSIIIFILSFLIIVSLMASLGVGIYKIVNSVLNGESQGFSSPC